MSIIHYSPDTTFTLQSIERPVQCYETTLFREHQLHKVTFGSSARQHYPADWIVLSFLVCLVLFAWVQFFYYKRLRQICYAPLSQRFFNILTKEGSLFNERVSLALSVIYLFTYSFFLSLILKEFIPKISLLFADYHICILCSSGLILFWMLKLSLIRFLGQVFQTKNSTWDYQQNILAFSFITGLILLPLLILTIFLQSKILLTITLAVICLLYFFRVMRGFFIGISLKKFSYIFLFVYLCSLEILPLLVILKGFYIFSKSF